MITVSKPECLLVPFMQLGEDNFCYRGGDIILGNLDVVSESVLGLAYNLFLQE